MQDVTPLYLSSLMSGKGEACDNNTFGNIKKALYNLSQDDSLAVIGYPTVTQFNVGLLYLLGHIFKRVGLVPSSKHQHAVLFEGFRGIDLKMRGMLEEIEAEIDRCRTAGDSTSVLAIMQINLLAG